MYTLPTQHYMLLSRGTDASSTNYDSSDKGKHFHFVTPRYDYLIFYDR